MARRGGFPGMGGGMNINKLMKEAKKMQADLEKSQSDLADKEFNATIGGGAVTIKMNGNKEILDLKIEEEVVDPEDVEMLQDLIISAFNEVSKKVDEETQALMGQFNIPGL